MDFARAAQLLCALLKEQDPDSARCLPRTELIAREEILEAIETARIALEGLAHSERGEDTRSGRRWAPRDDAALLKDFEAGRSLEELSSALKRSVFSIRARLAKLGKLDDGFNG